MMSSNNRQPLTIQEAACTTRRTFDVIGVVSSVSIDARQERACVLLVDPTSNESSARVTLRGANHTTSLRDVCSGDVVQCHGVIRQQNVPTTSIICELQHHWEHPHAGNALWTRLSRNGTIFEAGMRQVDTFSERVQGLLDWYASLSHRHAAASSKSLPPLPCRRRKLREITSAGIHSHVVVSVLLVETAYEKSRNRYSRQQQKKTTFATLSDETDVIMPFQRCCLFQDQLQSALQKNQHLLITNLVSVYSDDHDASSNELALLPTSTTTVSICPGINQFTSKSSMQRMEMPFLSLTQDYNASSTDQRTILSPLKDIYIEDLSLSLGEGRHFWSPAGFATIVIDTRRTPHYREATLTLDESISSDCFVVRCDGTLLQTLCGSVSVETMLNDSRVRRYAMDLLRGLLQEGTKLSWTLERVDGGEQYHVTKVSLPVL